MQTLVAKKQTVHALFWDVSMSHRESTLVPAQGIKGIQTTWRKKESKSQTLDAGSFVSLGSAAEAALAF